MKKRLFALVLLALVVTFTACGGSDDDAAETPPVEDEVIEIDGFDVARGLPAITLVNHDVTDSDTLETFPFRTVMGQELAQVTVISGGNIEDENGWVFNDAWAIELYYFTRRHETAAEAIAWTVTWDIDEGFFLDDSVLTVSPLHVSADGSSAMLTVLEEARSGQIYVAIYLAQSLPDSNDVVVLDILLFLEIWETYDDAVLEELSALIGLDLAAIVEALVPGFPVID